MAEFDLLIKDGILTDDTRSHRCRADLGIRAGRVAALGRLKTTDARRTLDASGMIVAPGFIDLHTHYDAQLFWDPYLTLSGWHGVTSVVIGNCGFGFAPLLIWVLGFERAKAGERPTDAEHRELRRLLHESMDAGGCGWSAQRLHPDGPGAVH